jgi:hypothetical protein
MTRHLLAGLFLSATLAAAESAHYDFYQKNGQNVLGAEIVSESATEYLVRLSYVPTPIKIQKANLARQPALSAVQPQITKKPSQLLQPNFALQAFAGYAFFNAGQVASIFGQGYRAGVGTDWLLFREPFWRICAITANVTFSRFQNSPRYIQTIDLQIGPKLLIYKWSPYGVTFYLTPTVGLAQVNLQGYTFESGYTNVVGGAVLAAEKHLGPIALALQLNTNSLFDKSQIFTATAFSLAAAYPLTAGAHK